MEDFKSQLESFITSLESDPSQIQNLTEDMVNNMTEEQVTKVRKLSMPYGRTIEGANKVVCLSVTNLKDEYMKKFHMTSLVSFLYRMMEEYRTEEYDSTVFVRRVRVGADEADFTQQDLKIINEFYPNLENLKGTHGSLFNNGMCVYEETDEQFFNRKEKLQRIYDYENSMKRAHVKEFLDNYFEYNPDMHVRRAKEKLSKHELATKEIVTDNETLEHTSNIPLDTFARYQTYINFNYEKLMDAVDTLYSVQPDIHFAINPYEVFTDDNDGKTAQQKSDDFIKKHQKEVITDILSVNTGSWNLIGPFSKNRERVNFLNDNTKVIEDMFKQIEIDAKLGADLMRKRVLIKKAQNIQREGATHPNFLNHTRENMPTVEAMGAEVVTESKLQTVEEKDALEVKVITIDAGKKTVNTSYFHTEASHGKQD